MSIAMMKELVMVRPRLGSNNGMGDHFCYEDVRANAPFVNCGDHICYKDRRANAPDLLKDSMITKMNSFKNFLVFCDLKVCSLWSVVRSLFQG